MCGHTYLRPKDANAAVGVHDRATQKAQEGYDMTDGQTYELFVHYSKIIVVCFVKVASM